MKKFLLLLIAFLLVGCSNQDEQNNAEPDSNTEEETTTESETKSTEDAVSVNFRKIDITTPEQQILIKGEAMATNNRFYYTLKYGEKVIVEETEVKLDSNKSGWGSFELKIDTPKSPDTEQKVPVFTFYVKNEAGDIINPNYIPVDLNQ